MKSYASITMPTVRRAVLSFLLASSLVSVVGCASMMKSKKKDAMPKEFSCGEALPGRPGRVQTEFQMPR